MSKKTQLSPYEAVMAYIANRHEGVDQDVIAKLYDVNAGRVAEAVIAVEYTVQHVKEIYHHARRKNGEEQQGEGR